MKYWPKFLIICVLTCRAVFVFAQNEALDWVTFRGEVLAGHPLARSADLELERAEAAVLRARGGFDLKTYGDFFGKNFNEKNYFRYGEAGLKLPTWAGLELKGAYNLASGDFLNPESEIPKAGQAAFGFNWTLGQGLLIDERRAGLLQARIGRRTAEATRAAVLNDLLFDAARAYWTWAVAASQVGLLEESLRQAEIRLEGLRESVAQGDKPPIDTTETLLQVQTRQLDLALARLELRNAALELANFRWQNAEIQLPPENLPAAPALVLTEPAPLFLPVTAENLRQNALARHPELRLYEAKLQDLAVERRWKNEKRKPVLDLNYTLLGNGWQFFPSPAPEGGLGVVANDVKYGVHVSFPLPNRKARGDWQITQIKIAQTELELAQKRRAVETKVRQYANEAETLASQLALSRALADNYRRLLDAELERFRFGESTIFLINTREQRWLEAQLKYLKLLGEFRKAEAAALWAAGALFEQ